MMDAHDHCETLAAPPGADLRLRAYPAADTTGWPEPEALIDEYLYLLGPDSKGVTGQLIRVRPRTDRG